MGLGILLAAALSAAAVPTVQYDVIDLGPNNFGPDFVSSINGSGVAVGASNGGAVVFADGDTIPLPFTSATRVNEDGDVAGLIVTPVPHSQVGFAEHAVVFRQGVLQDLGTLDRSRTDSSVAFDLNESGWVVGSTTLKDGTTRPVAWVDGAIQELPVAADDPTVRAIAINTAGQIAVSSETSGAYLVAGEEVTALGAFTATDISDTGVVAGWGAKTTQPAVGISVPVIWSQGTLTELPGVPLAQWTRAAAINTAGQLVGSFYAAGSFAPNTRGFVYQDGVSRDLNTMISHEVRWNIVSANDIDEAGRIVANGYIVQGDGRQHALLLVPR